MSGSISYITERMEHMAEWRRGKAEEFSNDRRNMEAAEELERLGKEISELDGSEISQRIDQLEAVSDDANYSMVEWLSEELRAVGFRSYYKDGAEFLKMYCERLEEEICEQEGQTLADQVEDNEAVKVAKQAYDEAAKVAKQAYDGAVRPAKQAYEEACTKAYAEARKRLG
jgi:L-fucose isomerase-like protein